MLIVYILFGSFCNKRHSFHRLNGMLACGGLARKHNRTGSVIDCICNVRYLGSCRSWVCYHRFKHLRSCYYLLACVVAFFDKLFLNCGYLFKGDFYSHISACYHYTVRRFYNLVDILNAVNALYLCDDTRICPAYRLYEFSEVIYIRR